MKAAGDFIGAIFLIALYIVPSIIGWLRHVRDLGPIVVINVLLGWTVIGWIIALAMSVRTATVKPTSPFQFQDGSNDKKE